jgi:predicted ABC-type ATPase
MKQPQLYVFAGPNGAGKSTLSASMLLPDTPIFDGDKEFALLKKQFPSTDSGNLYEAVNGHIFSVWKDKAKTLSVDCAFETNFRSSEVMNSVAEFKKSGYQTRLIFFGLDSLEASIERVKLRVASGGHQVSLDNIKANYEMGLENLTKFYHDFHSVHIVKSFASNELDNKLTSYLTIENGSVKEQAELIPNWANELIKVIEVNQSAKITDNQQPEHNEENKKVNSRRIGR